MTSNFPRWRAVSISSWLGESEICMQWLDAASRMVGRILMSKCNHVPRALTLEQEPSDRTSMGSSMAAERVGCKIAAQMVQAT